MNIDLLHSKLVCLLVVSVECATTSSNEHCPDTGANSRQVELRKNADDAPEHLGANITFTSIGVVGDILIREVVLPLEVILRFTQPLRLRPPHKGAEALDRGLIISLPFVIFRNMTIFAYGLGISICILGVMAFSVAWHLSDIFFCIDTPTICVNA